MKGTMLRSAIVAVTAATFAAPAFANTVSTNAVQLTLTKAGINQTGVTQGGIFSIQGNGLDTVANNKPPILPTISAAGLVSSDAKVTSVLNQPFSFTVTARQADTVGAGGAVATNAGRHTGQFADMTTKTTTAHTANLNNQGVDQNAANKGILTISNAGAIALAAGIYSGSTATGIISTTQAGRYSQVENRRIVSSSNTQNVTNSDTQQAKFSVAGNGVAAVTDGGLALGKDTGGNAVNAAAVGTSIGIEALAGGTCSQASNCGSGGQFNLTNEVTANQASVAMTATSTDATTPAYGIVDFTVGGTTAGAIVMTNLNTVTVVGGGAGTSSSLSQVGELTAFN